MSWLGLDHEYNAENLGLGYVDEANEASDLSVFSAMELIAIPPEKALDRISAILQRF